MYKNYHYEINLNSSDINLQIEVYYKKIKIIISDIYLTKF